MRTHRQLCLLNCVGVVFGLFTSACTGSVWYYWHWALNTCDDMSACGCILYGTWGFTEFSGGHTSNCSFVSIAPLPIVLCSVLYAIYHGFMDSSLKESPRILITKRPNITTQINPQRLPKLFAVCSSLLFVAASIILFSSGIVLTDGYFKTCKEYKKSVVDQLSANGDLANLISDRLSCGTVFDFLDYLQPDPEYLAMKYRRGAWMINTDVLLKFSVFSTWMTFSLYAVLAILYTICSRKPKIPRILLNTDL